ncbi:hypothetical protein O9X90_11535 [Agrobacterium leguminum]|uniref:hypothetical protein n=1 Tax=Agrobacterium leguminum TaxID=2792015 RepID=UPI0022B83789|nr:hypothetical protein [Agrobacterium leguminum]MCZ7932943.1 hypothetical protein [Agrobacterium leguminum]
MSIDTHSPSVAGFRCEAVTTDTVALPCLQNRLVNIPPVQFDDVDHGSSDRDDPAVLIGLALAFVRQGRSLDGLVPEPLMLRLRALTDGGNAACRLLLDWLRSRNRDLDRSLSLSVSTGSSADAHPPRERVLARIPKPGGINGRRRGRTRPRDPVQNAQTAIIAAETGGRIDG